jgi:hypothetical protein
MPIEQGSVYASRPSSPPSGTASAPSPSGNGLEIGATTVVFSIPPKPGATTNRVVLTLASD